MKTNKLLLSLCFGLAIFAAGCDDDDDTNNNNAQTETNCTDHMDNDGDGYTDCLDPDCASNAACQTQTETICNDGLDNDSDGQIDCADSDCATATNCQGQTETNCSNGADDDGDGAIDCADSDCAGNVACATNECDWDNIYSTNAAAACDDGFVCAPVFSQSGVAADPACVDEANYGTHAFYAECTAAAQCPIGSECLSFDGQTNNCIPFCNDAEGFACPTGGLCGGQIPNFTEFYLCVPTDDCDPIANTGCTGTDTCVFMYTETPETMCMPAGTVDIGGTCAALDDCVAGASCVGVAQGVFQCVELCDTAAPECPTGQTCQALDGTIGGCIGGGK